MGFAILRHGKIKGTAKGVCVAHNHRLGEMKSECIDTSLSRLNQYSGDAKVVARINQKLPEKRRKDAVEVVELLLTASPEFFDGLATDRAQLAAHPKFKEWVKTTAEWAKADLGQNIVDIALHMDETSPHMHVLFVPLIDGRLCAKEVTSRQEMQRRQTDYAKAVERFGLKRGQAADETRREHVPLKAKNANGGKAQGELVKIQEKLAKAQAAFKQQQNLNIENFHVIKALQGELKQVKAELQALIGEKTAPRVDRTERPVEPRKATQAPIPPSQAGKAPEKPFTGQQMALPETWKGLREVDAKQVEAGTVQEVVGDKARYHMGRGRYVIGPAPVKGPEQEKERSGPSVGR